MLTNRVTLFGWNFLVAWIIVVLATVFVEVIPAHFSLPALYLYKTIKVALFFLAGYLTPLTFWSFDRLNVGVALVAASATAIELLQGFIGNGHRLSVIELLAKLALIGFGFIRALDARYEGSILIGRFRLRLVNQDVPERS